MRTAIFRRRLGSEQPWGEVAEVYSGSPANCIVWIANGGLGDRIHPGDELALVGSDRDGVTSRSLWTLRVEAAGFRLVAT